VDFRNTRDVAVRTGTQDEEMIELESYMVPVSLPRRETDAARVRKSGIPRRTRSDSVPNPRSIKGFYQRLSKSMFRGLSLHRLLKMRGHTLAQRKTDYMAEGPAA
jgi:hypothetical protein